MLYGMNSQCGSHLLVQQSLGEERYVNPSDISVPPGFQIEAYAQGLNTPIGLAFTENGDMLIADSGITTGNPMVILLSEGQFHTIAEGFYPPITGINYRNGNIYVSHRGVISVVKMDGSRQDIIKGLPSYGDYGNNRVSVSQEGKIYFGQGTATNSGVVGLDNTWALERPHLHDYPGSFILINGINYETENLFVPAEESAFTGAFRPFGVPNTRKIEVIDGRLRASGSILRANPDGTDLELVAWGFRNPVQLSFDNFNQLYVLNQAYDNRGSRPIANAQDEMFLLTSGLWYGWPDYNGGEPVNAPRFIPEGGVQVELLLASLPSTPPRPVAVFPPGSNVMGLDFNPNPDFGELGDAFVAKFGSIHDEASDNIIRSGVGHRITRVHMLTGELITFAINKTGFPAISPREGGFGRPTDVKFGPDGAMYITDYSATSIRNPNEIFSNTGVIWRISRIN